MLLFGILGGTLDQFRGAWVTVPFDLELGVPLLEVAIMTSGEVLPAIVSTGNIQPVITATGKVEAKFLATEKLEP